MTNTPEKEHLSITDFAELSRTNRSTLLYYDKIGLLSPMTRKENNYRYYTYPQIYTVELIRTCQALGMSIDEIKNLRNEASPKLIDELFERQIEQIETEINTWISARKLLTTLKSVIHPMLSVDEKAFKVEYVPAEPIVLGGINDYNKCRNDHAAYAQFYVDSKLKYPDLDLNYPAWAMYSEERIKNGDWVWPDRFYFFNPDGYDKRPAAHYAIGYTRGGYGHTGDLYDRLIAYINASGYEICGPAFEEYPLTELCYTSDEDYLIRLMITVRKK
ncbi:MAG: MerR family transcriptional regulator [Oscillospiraceae bacterium]|nr:MerR family transcriptional regulator [Oscillospiraceae bacterium]